MRARLVKIPAALAIAALALPLWAAAPAAASDAYVQDGAGLFSAATVSSLDQEIGDFNQQTGKEIEVVTVPSLDGATAADAAEKVFAQQQVNGVLIFMSKAEKQDGIIGDRASQQFFPAGTFATIRQAMRGYFRSGDYDEGITTGVNLVLAQYRSHERALRGGSARAPAPASTQSVGGGMSLFWLILVLVVGFLIIRAIFRAMAGPRMMPPGYGGQGPGYGPGYGGPGPGYGYGGGGGGSFFSGLLGGLGGAFLGNELFGHQNAGYVDPGAANAGLVGGGDQGGGDAAGWQSDPGQADTSNASFGSFGGDGGGFGGDGGGFGGDGGGGGGDGGGW
jgi:uncharacterized protein